MLVSIMILTKVTDRIATLAFNRPEKLNALSAELLSSSIETLRGWSTDPTIGVIVVTGIGRAFCAGGDVSMMAKESTAKESNQSLEENIDSMQDLHANLSEQGIDPRTVPLVLQYNKCDLARNLILDTATLDDALNFRSVPSIPAAAVQGTGVFDTLRAIAAAVLTRVSTV